MRALIDTDVLSQLIKPKAVPGVLEWFDRQVESDLFLSAVSLFEIRNGIELLPQGKRRDAFDHWLSAEILLRFSGRILPVDERIADRCGRMAGKIHREGYTAEATDIMIAATAEVHGLEVATLNLKHFERLGVELVNFLEPV